MKAGAVKKAKKKPELLELGDAIHLARKGAGMTLRELAKSLDAGSSVVQQYEVGQSNPPAWRLHLIAKATGYTFTVDKRGWRVARSRA
jgi:transcriptional regulator with XRE-family HTH domain